MKKSVVLLVLVLLLSGCAVKDNSAMAYQQITPQKAIEIMDTTDDYILLDVRTQEEYQTSHIPGAICIPNEEIGEEPPAQLPKKDQTILVYCRSGNRSKQAAQKLADLGYTNILEFGGIIDWPGETVSGQGAGSGTGDPDANTPGSGTTGDPDTNTPGSGTTGDPDTNTPGSGTTGDSDANTPGSGTTGDPDANTPGSGTTGDSDVTVPDFSKITFSKKQYIAYTTTTVKLLNETGTETDTEIPAGNSLLVTGVSEDWVRVRRGAVQCYLTAEAVTEQRPDAAVQASQACGGTVYPGAGPVVAIDPGHQNKGMKDKEPNGPGSDEMKAMLTSGTQGVATKLTEYQLNLKVGLLLRDELIARGYTVVMIRESNAVTLSNVQRAQIANLAKADAFVRIHANGSDNTAKQGAYTICQTAKNPYNAELHGESLQLSRKLLDGFIAATGQKKLSIWETDTMTGINWAEVPSTILEMGYMSNAEEDRRMASDDFQKAAALGMADGLDAYFAK